MNFVRYICLLAFLTVHLYLQQGNKRNGGKENNNPNLQTSSSQAPISTKTSGTRQIPTAGNQVLHGSTRNSRILKAMVSRNFSLSSWKQIFTCTFTSLSKLEFGSEKYATMKILKRANLVESYQVVLVFVFGLS